MRLLESAARAMWEAEEGQPWAGCPPESRADLQRDMEPIVRAVLASLAALPAAERARLLVEAA